MKIRLRSSTTGNTLSPQNTHFPASFPLPEQQGKGGAGCWCNGKSAYTPHFPSRSREEKGGCKCKYNEKIKNWTKETNKEVLPCFCFLRFSVQPSLKEFPGSLWHSTKTTISWLHRPLSGYFFNGESLNGTGAQAGSEFQAVRKLLNIPTLSAVALNHSASQSWKSSESDAESAKKENTFGSASCRINR